MDSNDRFSASVEALRKAAGDSQDDLARGAGISQSKVSRRLEGSHPWQLPECDEVARHYGMTVADLLAGPTHALERLPEHRRAGRIRGRQTVLEDAAAPVRKPAGRRSHGDGATHRAGPREELIAAAGALFAAVPEQLSRRLHGTVHSLTAAHRARRGWVVEEMLGRLAGMDPVRLRLPTGDAPDRFRAALAAYRDQITK